MEKIVEKKECVICYEEYELFGIGSCNHKGKCAVCHYKQRVKISKIDCAFCQTPNDIILIHSDPEIQFSDLDPQTAIEFGEGAIYFPNSVVQHKFEQLIGLKCPFEDCQGGRSFLSKVQLKNHLKERHKRYFW